MFCAPQQSQTIKNKISSDEESQRLNHNSQRHEHNYNTKQYKLISSGEDSDQFDAKSR